ncbi:MAG: asparagine synthase (glutamine-hydrolyzing), partial [Candidatus Falkowbacteria bacterium]
GIVGYFGNNLPELEKIKEVRDLLARRGPDDKGYYYDAKENIALAHRRLSIIDLSSAGHQPFFSNCGRYVVTYNGEIYNYLEIRDELKNDYNFKTNTDTEVLLASYIKYGEKCLEKFNGMFAFAIYDKKEKKLFCARDRLGIKPFFYYCDNNKFIFASEIKAILSLRAEKEVNNKAIFDYLYYGFYDHSDETFFKNIKKMEAGHFAILQDGKINIKKYWDLDRVDYDFKEMPENKIKNKFEELLTDSIKLRFRSDVHVGINLSSGLDSNALRYYTNKITGKNISMFTMRTVSKEYDEGKILEAFLNNKEKKHWHTCFIKPEANLIKQAEEMQEIQDQPYGGIPTIVYLELIKLVKNNNTTVLLEGQGLDELLAGYKYYNNPQSLQFSQDMSKLIDADVLSKNFVQQYENEELKFRSPFSDDLLNAQYRDIKYTKLPRVLRFNDHVTMYYGRELRVPFLDHRIVEFCFHIPKKYKIRGEEQKFLIRDLMKDKFFNIGSIPKKTFGAVQSEWFRNNYKDEILSLINSESFKNRIYWDYEKLNKKINNFFTGDGNNSFFIWQCVNLEIWLKKYIN